MDDGMFHRMFHGMGRGPIRGYRRATSDRPRASFAVGLIGLLLPRGCAGCDAPDETICPSCRVRFSHVIARPLPGSLTGRAYACAVYGRQVRRAILAWKDHGDEECDREFARLIAGLAARIPPIPHGIGPAGASSLVVVPAPSTAGSLAQRGRRHLMPLARAVATYYRSCGVDARVEAALEFRGAAAGTSHGRSGKNGKNGKNGRSDGTERWNPVRWNLGEEGPRAGDGKAVETSGAGQRASRTGGRLAVRSRSRERMRGESVVIVDDIITTGATMRACAAALEASGARVVSGLALAATPRYGASAG